MGGLLVYVMIFAGVWTLVAAAMIVFDVCRALILGLTISEALSPRVLLSLAIQSAAIVIVISFILWLWLS